MNVLILGSGGREHALAWKISKSSLCKNLFIAPGNGGTEDVGENISIDISNFKKIGEFCIKKEIEIMIIGPEKPLVDGLYDFFKNDAKLNSITVIGPSKEGACLEGSKDFAKKFMNKYNIPTAKHQSFTANNIIEGYEFLESLTPPFVLKADGLAAGKGVLIINDLNIAKKELKSMLINKKFGNASHKVVIEEYLEGIEISMFILTDGSSYKILPSAKDYKRIGEGDMGLNTGGMGAISPVNFADRFFIEKVEREIIKPTMLGIKTEKIDYKGFIFFGLIVKDGNAKVIEYNVRMGDPETEVVIPRIKSDLLNLFKGIGDGSFSEIDFNVSEKSAATIMLVSGGYPEKYSNGEVVNNLNNICDSLIFHAGTKKTNKKTITNGGRVIAVTSVKNNMKEAIQTSLNNAEKITFKNKYYRKDIGLDLQ